MIRIFCAFLSSLLLIVSFPTFDLGFVAWIALVPLLVALEGQSLKSAFLLSFVTGIISLMGVFYWINIIDGFRWFHFLILGLYLGSYFGIFGLLLSLVSRNGRLPFTVSAPFLWVSLEYARSNAGFLALPWPLLGYSQYTNLPIIQIASITGVYGVSFLIVLINAAISDAALLWIAKQGTQTREASSVLAGVVTGFLGIALSLIYGLKAMSNEIAEHSIRVAVIQGNISQETKWQPALLRRHLEKHIRLTKDVVHRNRPAIVVWPEASAQGFLSQDLYLRTTLSTLARETNAHLLIGSSQRPKFGSKDFRRKNWFNSAFLVAPTGAIVGRYNKIHLVPFAEYLPQKETIAWPADLVSQAGHFIPGADYTIFALEGTRFGVVICWESIFPDHFRRFALNGAGMMVNITNEAWFGNTAAPYQFLAMTVFRAVENRIPIARAANTGVSAFIDAQGRVIGKVEREGRDLFVEGYLTVRLMASSRMTFYTRCGDVFAWVCVTFTSAAALLCVRMPRPFGRL